MMKWWTRRSLVSLVAAFLAASAGASAQQAPAADNAPSGKQAAKPEDKGDAVALVGIDLTDDECRWQARTDVPAERGAPPAANIYCGTAKRPIGYVTATLMPLSLPADPDEQHKVLERAAAETALGSDDATRMSCAAGKWAKTQNGIDLFLQPCALNDSEWPQVVAVAPIGPLLMRAEGVPVGLPAYLEAMARLAGKPELGAAFSDAPAARQRLVDLAGERWLKATPSDYDDYTELTETARVEASRNNYGAAEGHYRSALAILTNVFGEQSPGVGLLMMELALQVSNQERFDEAAALFRRANPIIQSDGTPSDLARLQLYQAFDAANRGRFDQALEFVDNSANTWRDIINQGGGVAPGLGSDTASAEQRGELAFTLDLEAEMALRTGNLAEADAAVSEASEIIGDEQGLPPWWRAEVLTTLGEVRAAQDRMDEAESAFRAALVLHERLFGATAPTAQTYLVFGRVFTEHKLYPEAVHAFELALDILRKDEVARSQVVVDEIAPFVVAANAYAQSNPGERGKLDSEVFEATQLIGKSLVDDTVNRVAARLAQSAPAIAGLVDELERTRRARDSARLALAQEVSLPDDQRGSDRENALMAAINTNTTKADTLEKQIETRFPDYAKFANPGPVSLSDVQGALQPNEALVLVEMGRERSFTVLVRKDQMLARAIALTRADLASDVEDLRKAFVVREGKIEPFDTQKSYELYRGLLGSVASGLDGVSHLIVVPTGPLASLPLGLLVTEPPKPGAQRDYAAAQWLLRRTAVSDIPSARAFFALRSQPASTEATQTLFAIANPNFGGTAGKPGGADSGLKALDDQCRDAGPMPASLIRGLAPLPDTADEVRKVAAILHADPGSILMGSDVTEPRVRAMPLARYRVLYFATHGLLPTALKCQSEPALVLSAPTVPATSRDNDGVLDASEVAELHLNADLVVLSACNTATAGGEFGGESLSGLAGAFFHAGARSVLASHWEVPSAQTVQLMTGLFERLGPNLNGGIAEAQRQSQLVLASKPETAHPFFWAAFTLIGDGGARTVQQTADNSTGSASSPAGAKPTNPTESKQ